MASLRGSSVQNVTARGARRDGIALCESIGAVTPCDVIVVGGGITGCAVARDAAARGLSVALLEKTDLAAGTSGRSTKLLHGGLRYLEHGHLRLVREALREREVTARLAPALARPLRIYLPILPGVFPGRLAARLGVGIYDLLAGRHPLGGGRSVGAEEIRRLVPSLAPGFTGAVEFADRQTDDVRLTVAIARDAAGRGAEIRLGVTVVALARSEDGYRVSCRDEEGRETEWSSRCVVNAGGPWADRVRALAGASRPLLGTSRGAHLVVAGLPLGTAMLLPGQAPGHRLFAIPWRGAVLFGTTDVADGADPGRELPEVDDLRSLFGELVRLFPGAGLTRRSVISSYTGVRPLLRHAGDPLSSSREHRVVDEDGLITIAGGKLTTWRTMAIDAVDAAARRLGLSAASPPGLASEPLVGGSDDAPPLDAVVAHEMARHADDVVFRRLPIGHDPDEARRRLPAIVETMGRRLGWSEERKESERRRVIARLDADVRRLDEALGAA
jgi:glycerol-3-phosphate dehydrogenase